MVKRRNSQPVERKPVVPLKVLRAEVGMTQAELAEALGVSKVTVSRCERGKTELLLTLSQVRRLCSITGKTLDELPETLGLPSKATN